jgi:hypothetical protein
MVLLLLVVNALELLPAASLVRPNFGLHVTHRVAAYQLTIS